MNVIIVDSDCKRYFPQEDMIRALINDPQCMILYLEPMQKLNVPPDCRCLLLTAMNSGFKKYHFDLFNSNPQVRNWIISIVNVSLKSEQSQLLDDIRTRLSNSKAVYSVLFDDAVALEKTAIACSIPLKEKRTCLITSCNSTVARQCALVVSSYLDDWDVIYMKDDTEEFYQAADVIVAVGERKEDFILPAPKYNMGRVYAWIKDSGQNLSELRNMVYDTLTEHNWNLGDVKNIYSSALELEEYFQKVSSGELSALELVNDERFVIWDKYGLPLSSKDYSEDAIYAFLNSQCCFNNLTANFE